MKVIQQLGSYLAMVLCIFPLTVKSQTKPEVQGNPWVVKSNQYTVLLMDLDRKYSPEQWSSRYLFYYL